MRVNLMLLLVKLCFVKLHMVKLSLVEFRKGKLRMAKFLLQDETEWQHYLRASIEIVVKVSELLPDDVLQIVVKP
jgi:hypothetical protein